MSVGRIAQIWRHPVKSIGGERIEAAEIGPRGIPGDRAWAVRDETRGGIRGAKKIPAQKRCSARYASAPAPGRTPAPEIGLPGGETLRADAPDANERVSAAVGTKVTLWPLRPASDLEHYKRGAPDTPDVAAELRAIFGRNPDEPLPDLSVFPPDLFQYESPPGTYFDAFPLLLLSTASLRRIQQLAPASHIDVRRGRWAQAIQANSKAIAADDAYRKQSPQQGFYQIYMAHNRHMLTYAAMMRGQSQLAIKTINEMAQGIPADWLRENAAVADGFAAMPVEVLVRFGRWEEILAEPFDSNELDR